MSARDTRTCGSASGATSARRRASGVTPAHVEERDRAEARHRRAEVLERVGAGRGFEAFDERHRPVVAGETADHAAERAPFVQALRREIDADTAALRGAAFQMEAVARRAPGQPRGERRGPAFEVGARAAHRVGVDHHAGIAEGDVLAARRRLDGLVVDAGVGHQHAELDEGGDGALFQREHGGRSGRGTRLSRSRCRAGR